MSVVNGYLYCTFGCLSSAAEVSSILVNVREYYHKYSMSSKRDKKGIKRR